MPNKMSKRMMTVLVLGLTMTLGGADWAVACKKAGGCGGGGDDKGGAQHGGDNAPIRITFGDQMGYMGDRIAADEFSVVYDDGIDGIDAFIGSGGAEGNIFLWLAGAPARGLYMDFADCVSVDSQGLPSCTSPFPPTDWDVNLSSSIVVTPGDIVSGGLLGMEAGQTVHAPAELTYDFGGADGPGHIYFKAGTGGKGKKANTPCANKSMNVKIHRPTADPVWKVSADSSILACVTLPGGEFSGQYRMNFSFTVEPLP